MKKISLTTASLTLSLGLVVSLGGVAMAQGHGSGKSGTSGHGPTTTALSGTPTCDVHGVVVFSSDGSVTFRGNITPTHGVSCEVNGMKLRTGHFSSALSFVAPTTTTSTTTTTSATAPTVPTTAVSSVCIPVPSGSIPNLANGAIRWNARARIAPSQGISFSTGTASPNSSGHLTISYAAGSVTSGSFAGSTASLSLTSNQTMTQLQARCAGSRFAIAVRGTITL